VAAIGIQSERKCLAKRGKPTMLLEALRSRWAPSWQRAPIILLAPCPHPRPLPMPPAKEGNVPRPPSKPPAGRVQGRLRMPKAPTLKLYPEQKLLVLSTLGCTPGLGMHCCTSGKKLCSNACTGSFENAFHALQKNWEKVLNTFYLGKKRKNLLNQCNKPRSLVCNTALSTALQVTSLAARKRGESWHTAGTLSWETLLNSSRERPQEHTAGHQP